MWSFVAQKQSKINAARTRARAGALRPGCGKPTAAEALPLALVDGSGEDTTGDDDGTREVVRPEGFGLDDVGWVVDGAVALETEIEIVPLKVLTGMDASGGVLTEAGTGMPEVSDATGASKEPVIPESAKLGVKPT